MADIVDLKGRPVPTPDDLDFVVEMARFAEGLADEAAIRKKFRLTDEVWNRLGEDDNLVQAITDEKTRRVRNGACKREKAQLLVVKAPDVAASIMNSDQANGRHRLDACKILNDLSTNPSESTATISDRFIIQINLGNDSLTFNRSIKPDPHDVDLGAIDSAPRTASPVVIANKSWDDDG